MTKTSDIKWTPEAQARLKKAPFFIRGIARRRVEKAAAAQNLSVITLDFMEQIKEKEMGA